MLVIGAGPGGLFAAAELARHGVAARLVDQAPRPHHEARATSLKPGVVEILDSVGAAEPLLDRSVHLRGSRMYDSELDEFASMSYDGLDCRYEFMLQLPQHETIRVLDEYLQSFGGSVERGVTARMGPSGSPDQPVIQLVDVEGRVETIEPDVVIDAGGAHSTLRGAMAESLEGTTYPGHFLVADIAVDVPLARDEGHFVFGPHGFLQLAGLPDQRWISFMPLELDEHVDSGAEVAARVRRGLGGGARDVDVGWFSTFRMHRRIVPRMSGGRLFLIGDAAHMSSTFAGQGQNAALQDAYDLAWKLALVLRGGGSQALLDAYAIERTIADQHVLAVSDETHRGIIGLADVIKRGGDPPHGATDPVTAALRRDASAMVDIDFAGSPIVTDLARTDADTARPSPGMRYPDWNALGGSSHHVLSFGAADDAPSLERLSRRWSPLVRFSLDLDVDPARAGLPHGGLVSIRPDGHIGFRASSVDADAVAALDAHLGSYLIAPT